MRHSTSLALLLALAAAPAAADTLKASYSVVFLGLSIGAADYTASFDGAGYRAEVATKLSGLAALMSSSKGSATATGAVSAGRIVSATYATTSANAELTRTVRMLFGGGNAKAVDISPPIDDKPGRIPLTDASKIGVIDPLSATIMPVAAGQPLVGPGVCNRSLPIFDGFARFNVNLAYVGTRQVSVSGYKGPVTVCSVRYVPIAGHRPDKTNTKFMINNKQIDVWLAPVERAHVVVPYRISVLTQLKGTVVIEAQKLSIDGPGQATVAQ